MIYLARVALVVALSMSPATAADIDEPFSGADNRSLIERMAARAGFGLGRDFAIIIGIGKYDDAANFEPLTAPERDALALKDFLIDEAGFHHVRVLTNYAASKERIGALIDDLSEEVRNNDRVLVFYIGHGIAEERFGIQQGYLPLSESRAGRYGTMIGMRQIDDWAFRLSKARQVLFALNTCVSGLAGTQSFSASRTLAPGELRRRGHDLITSARAEERSYALENQSYFTSAFLEGARGAADGPTSPGIVTLSELMSFLRDRLRDRLGERQSMTPQRRTLNREDAAEFFFITDAAVRSGDESDEEQGVVFGLGSTQPPVTTYDPAKVAFDDAKTLGTKAALEDVARFYPNTYWGNRAANDLVAMATEQEAGVENRYSLLEAIFGKRYADSYVLPSMRPDVDSLIQDAFNNNSTYQSSDIVLPHRKATHIINIISDEYENKNGGDFVCRKYDVQIRNIEPNEGLGRTIPAIESACRLSGGKVWYHYQMPTRQGFQVDGEENLEHNNVIDLVPSHLSGKLYSDEENYNEIESILSGNQESVDIKSSLLVGDNNRGVARLDAIEDHLRPDPSELPDLGTFRDCPACPEMVVIPAGRYQRGSPGNYAISYRSELPQHWVTIPRFAIATTETTFDQWAACVTDGGCENNPAPLDRGTGRGAHPVFNVSWYDAQEFVSWLNNKAGDEVYHLPSEAEWEYAARAGSSTVYPWGDDWEAKRAHGNIFNQLSTEVGLYPANDFGLRDMIGNVEEWTQDCWHKTYDGAPSDERPWLDEHDGDCSERVFRGGGASTRSERLRSASRKRRGSNRGYNGVGFRVARSLTP